MNIFDALAKVEFKRQLYFKYKHNFYYRGEEKPKNDEEFLKRVGRKTFDSFKKWEKEVEYQNLLSLMMEADLVNDVHKAYKAVSDKAKQGDEKAIKTMLELGKEIKALANTARSRMNEKVKKKDEVVVEDDLDLDLS